MSALYRPSAAFLLFMLGPIAVAALFAWHGPIRAGERTPVTGGYHTPRTALATNVGYALVGSVFAYNAVMLLWRGGGLVRRRQRHIAAVQPREQLCVTIGPLKRREAVLITDAAHRPGVRADVAYSLGSRPDSVPLADAPSAQLRDRWCVILAPAYPTPVYELTVHNQNTTEVCLDLRIYTTVSLWAWRLQRRAAPSG